MTDSPAKVAVTPRTFTDPQQTRQDPPAAPAPTPPTETPVDAAPSFMSQYGKILIGVVIVLFIVVVVGFWVYYKFFAEEKEKKDPPSDPDKEQKPSNESEQKTTQTPTQAGTAPEQNNTAPSKEELRRRLEQGRAAQGTAHQAAQGTAHQVTPHPAAAQNEPTSTTTAKNTDEVRPTNATAEHANGMAGPVSATADAADVPEPNEETDDDSPLKRCAWTEMNGDQCPTRTTNDYCTAHTPNA